MSYFEIVCNKEEGKVHLTLTISSSGKEHDEVLAPIFRSTGKINSVYIHHFNKIKFQYSSKVDNTLCKLAITEVNEIIKSLNRVYKKQELNLWLNKELNNISKNDLLDELKIKSLLMV